jgi:hypothetical protein
MTHLAMECKSSARAREASPFLGLPVSCNGEFCLTGAILLEKISLGTTDAAPTQVVDAAAKVRRLEAVVDRAQNGAGTGISPLTVQFG